MGKKGITSVFIIFTLLCFSYTLGCQKLDSRTSSGTEASNQQKTETLYEGNDKPTDTMSETAVHNQAGQLNNKSESDSEDTNPLDDDDILAGELSNPDIRDDMKQLTFKLTNNSDRELGYNRQIFLEEYSSKEWTVLYDNNIGEVGTILPAHSSSDEIFPLKRNLKRGTYRFVVSYELSNKEEELPKQHKCYIEFKY